MMSQHGDHDDDFNGDVPGHPDSMPDFREIDEHACPRHLSPEESEARLTAFALGELDPSDCADVERILAADEAARARVDEVRRLGVVLGRAMSSEASAENTSLVLDPARRRELLSRMEQDAMASAEDRAAALAILRRMQSPGVRVAAGLTGLAAVLALGFYLPTLSRRSVDSLALSDGDDAVLKKESPQAGQGQNRVGDTESLVSRLQQNAIIERPFVGSVEAGSSGREDGLLPTGTSLSPVDVSGGAGQLHQTDVDAFQLSRSNLSDSPASPGSVEGAVPPSGDQYFGRWEQAETRNPQRDSFAEYGEGLLEIGAESRAKDLLERGAVDEAERHRAGHEPEFQPRYYYRTHPLPPTTADYEHPGDNPFYTVIGRPLSTFSTDVDTASYANVRRFLNAGQLPPPDAVRVEEMINYFTYDYDKPEGEDPFSINTEIGRCPWDETHRLVRVGLKGRDISIGEQPGSNLVFLVDVSGSMEPANRLPLVKTGLGMMLDVLGPSDRLAIVTYAGSSGVALPSTMLNETGKSRARAVIDSLEAGGSTNGASGIQLAYDAASEGFIDKGINRVILATDGDFNVGVTDRSDLVTLIENKARLGVCLTVLGVGDDNLKDATIEQLADKGNGQYAYLDSVDEARRVLVEQATGTLMVIAKDVKVQVEFNPRTVSAYRLIGYENRLMADKDFNDDLKDAGDIGSGHTVTVLYEIVPSGVEIPMADPGVDPLKYQKAAEDGGPARVEEAMQLTDAAQSNELLTVKLRYKKPDAPMNAPSILLERALIDSLSAEPTEDFRFAAAVAQFGLLLRRSYIGPDASFEQVIAQAEAARTRDPDGYRGEFVRLAKIAQQASAR